MDLRYKTLLNILDTIRSQAPQDEQYSRFQSSDINDVEFSRGQSFIHLFLWVKYGIEDFSERQCLICDGSYDGGLDAYFIDDQRKIIYLIQSKFKNSSQSFISSEISADELVKIDIAIILKGAKKDTTGKIFNNKIQEFQKKLKKISDIALYEKKVIVLANLKKFTKAQINKLIGNFDYEVYNFEKTYLELVLPFCSGTYYDTSKLEIQVNLSGKSQPILAQTVRTSHGNAEIRVVFAPTFEIAKIMAKYKNAILKYNPRNYLQFQKNAVNRNIKRSIVDCQANDFAILNNGITILASEFKSTEQTGKQNVGQIVLTNPQIINGGQTAFTLSRIYELEYLANPKIFTGKEVMLRIVVLDQKGKVDLKKLSEFIDLISNSTNQQTSVTEADRRSNNENWKRIQKAVFERYGYFLEIKQGEFFLGTDKGFLAKDFVVDRSDFLKCHMSFVKGEPSKARSKGDNLFIEPAFSNQVGDPDENEMELLVAQMLFSYLAFRHLFELEKSQNESSKYGFGLKYGKYAVLFAIAKSIEEGQLNNLDKVESTGTTLLELARREAERVLLEWESFEKCVQSLEHNQIYTHNETVDFDNYYKGRNLKEDIQKFFGLKPAQ